MNPSQAPDLSALLQSAGDDGILSNSTMANLAFLDLSAQLGPGMGLSVADVSATEVLLVTLQPDDSSSIRTGQNVDVVCEGHNGVIVALVDSKQRSDILFGTQYLNGFWLNPYCLIENATRMDRTNYSPSLGTPLYDGAFALLTGVIAKSQEFRDAGVRARTQTLIISDGSDQHSKAGGLKRVRALVDDMLATEDHIIAAMGIDDGRTDFRKVFGDMGIRQEWILTPGNTQSEIRKAFGVFSQSAVRASQGAASFSQAMGGGFAN